jgi:hypothetical protein
MIGQINKDRSSGCPCLGMNRLQRNVLLNVMSNGMEQQRMSTALPPREAFRCPNISDRKLDDDLALGRE